MNSEDILLLNFLRYSSREELIEWIENATYEERCYASSLFEVATLELMDETVNEMNEYPDVIDVCERLK